MTDKTKYKDLVEIGCWVDDALHSIDDKYIKKLKDANINSVCIMTNKSNTRKQDKPWELRTSKEEFIRLGNLFKNNGFMVTFTCWPQPNKNQIDMLVKDMEEIVSSTSSELEIDSETNWDKKFLGGGFKTMKEAADYLNSEFAKIKLKHGTILSLTSYVYHSEFSDKALLSPHMDKLFCQAYSVHKRDTGDVGFNDSLGPSKIQQTSYDRSVKTKTKGIIAMGLPAYDQKFPNYSEDQAMRTALDKCVSLGIKHVRYWSSKFIIGGQKNGYSETFLKTLK